MLIGREIWDITPLFELKPPKAKRKILCPICGCSKLWFKHARVFKRHHYPHIVEKIGEQYRIDIAVKCNDCACVIIFGVHITQQEYNKLISIFRANLNSDMLEYYHTGHRLIEYDNGNFINQND